MKKLISFVCFISIHAQAHVCIQYPDFKAKIEIISCRYNEHGIVGQIARGSPVKHVGTYRLKKEDQGIEIRGIIRKVELIKSRTTKEQPGVVLSSTEKEKKYKDLPEKYEDAFYLKTTDKAYCEKLAKTKEVEASLYFYCCPPKDVKGGCSIQQKYYSEQIIFQN